MLSAVDLADYFEQLDEARESLAAPAAAVGEAPPGKAGVRVSVMVPGPMGLPILVPAPRRR